MTETQIIVSDAQRKLVDAMNFLYNRCDGAKALDGMGFKAPHRTGFLEDMHDIGCNKGMTAKQMLALHNILSYYVNTQLNPAGFELPTKAEIFAGAAATGKTVPGIDKNIIMVDGQFIWLHYIFDRKTDLPDRMQKLKEAYRARCDSIHYKKYTGSFERNDRSSWCSWLNQEEKLGLKGWWRFPLAPATLKLITEYFPMADLTAEASQYMRRLIEHEQAAMMQAQQKEQKLQKALAEITGDLDSPLPDGKLLFNHQKIAVRYFVEKLRVICGDKMGLGKTLESLVAAKRLQDYYGWRILVITTKSNMSAFDDTAAMLGCNIDCTTWRGMPIATNEYPHAPFVLIADEAHYAAYMESQQSKNFLALAWHPKCQAVFCMTGTPAKNGRPVNLYPLLLAVKHPLVFSLPDTWYPEYPLIWKKSSEEEGMLLPAAICSKKNAYERNYCDAHEKFYGKKKVWKKDGASNLEALNIFTQYRPERKENHAWACMISRRKEECLDLPEKRRIMQVAEISPEAEKLFHQKIKELKAKFEANIKTKLRLLKEALEKRNRGEEVGKIDKSIALYYQNASKKVSLQQNLHDAEETMRSAEALNAYMTFKHASALAKAEQTLAQVLELIDTDQKCVIFTNFKDVAEWLTEQIHKSQRELERDENIVATINGDVSREDRDSYVKDFQSDTGKLKVMIGLAAAKEGLTLTAASTLIMNDRFWTPGDCEQAEDRIHRIGSKNECFVYWVQLPKGLCDIDIRIDTLLDQKLVNIAQMQYGEKVTGIEFYDDKDLKALAAKAMRNLLENKKSRRVA